MPPHKSLACAYPEFTVEKITMASQSALVPPHSEFPFRLIDLPSIRWETTSRATQWADHPGA